MSSRRPYHLIANEIDRARLRRDRDAVLALEAEIERDHPERLVADTSAEDEAELALDDDADAYRDRCRD